MSNSKRMLRSAEVKKYTDYSLQLSRWFLLLIGAWPRTSASSIPERMSTIVLIPVCIVVVAIIMIPCMLYILFEAQGLQSKLNAIGAILHRVMGSVNYWTLISRSDDIRNCMQHMETDWKLVRRIHDREIMVRYAKTGRLIATICAFFMHCSSLIFSVDKTIKTVTIVVDNKTITMYPMTCPVYRKIVDVRYSPANEIALVFQFLSTFVVSTSTVGVCSLAAVFATHACGQLHVLYAWLNELAENQKNGNHVAERKLAAIVEHHLRALSFLSHLESIMNKASLVELMGCTGVMCLLGYYAIMDWATFDTARITSYVILYLSMSFNIFIFCYIGEIVTEQCKHVGEMAYMSDWYKLHHKTALGLVLIITRSSNVIKITAGKLFHLSIATFGDVVTKSFYRELISFTLTAILDYMMHNHMYQ